jgi:NADH dehydrogenase
MKNIVILGAGFGGLQAALTLSKKHPVILVDKSPFHIFTPLLYEIATTPPEIADNLKLQELISFPIKDLVAGKNIDFVNDCVEGIDTENKKIQLSRSELDYEYLINALGSEVNYFNVPGLKENSLHLKTFADAIKLRDRLTGKKRIVIGGGGATGVELAGEIKLGLPETEITVIDAGPSILANMDKRVTQKAERRLGKLGISVMSNTRISKVDDKCVYFENGDRRECDLIIWTGGVKANSLVKERIETPGTMNVDDGVYAAGDISKLAPMMARPAMIEGRIAAKNVLDKISGGKDKYYYKNRNYPYIVPVGGKYAVAKIGPLVLSGLPAWTFKGLTELNYFLSIMPFFTALKVWFKGFLIFIKNDRLG